MIVSYNGCPICKIFNKYNWTDLQIDEFNKFLENDFVSEFTEYQREQLKFEFSILVEDIADLNNYYISKHKRNCSIKEDIAITIGEQEPEDFLTRKEARELIHNFRQLDYRDQKNTVARNWLEVIALLIASTKKGIERNIVQRNDEILSRRDIEVSKLVIETFKIPTFENDVNIKNVSNNKVDGIDKYKGKLNDIKKMFNKS